MSFITVINLYTQMDFFFFFGVGGEVCATYMQKQSPLGSSSVWGHSLYCLHPLLLNHISEVRAGLCAAYTAGRERKSGLESHLTPTAVTVHAVLLFRGRMMCREMKDEKEVLRH